MKKSVMMSVLAILALVMGGCGGAKPQVTTQLEAPAECTFDGTTDPAPLWVCSNPVDGIPVTAVGSHPKSQAGPAFMKNMASAAARAELATSFKAYVEQMVKQYIGTTGIGDSETVDAANSVTGKLITKETLNGSKIYRTITAPNGTMYVLVGMDEELARTAAKNLIATSFKNDQALWQEFKSQKSHEELAAEIAKIQPQ